MALLLSKPDTNGTQFPNCAGGVSLLPRPDVMLVHISIRGTSRFPTWLCIKHQCLQNILPAGLVEVGLLVLRHNGLHIKSGVNRFNTAKQAQMPLLKLTTKALWTFVRASCCIESAVPLYSWYLCAQSNAKLILLLLLPQVSFGPREGQQTTSEQLNNASSLNFLKLKFRTQLIQLLHLRVL